MRASGIAGAAQRVCGRRRIRFITAFRQYRGKPPDSSIARRIGNFRNQTAGLADQPVCQCHASHNAAGIIAVIPAC